MFVVIRSEGMGEELDEGSQKVETLSYKIKNCNIQGKFFKFLEPS